MKQMPLQREKARKKHLHAGGSMYKISVESPLFRGKKLLAQHRLVTETLEKEIGEMHGLNISTKASPA